MPQLDPTWFASQIFWLLITFVVLYLALARGILPSLMDVMARRKEKLESDVEAAQRFKSEADDARQQYERALTEARGRAQQSINEAMLAHKARSEQAGRDMDAQIAVKLKEAENAISAKKQELLANLGPATADLAAVIVEKLTQRAPAADKVKAALNELSKSRS